jgi:ADP-ribose pyrophosphatase YjhB (NUDIX family)
MSDTPRHSVSVAAAIFDDAGEKVLLIKRRDNGRWEPPGGVLELKESIEEGLRREVLEETGAAIEICHLTGVYKNMQRGIVALVFRGRASSEPATSTAEAELVAWHPLTTLSDIMADAYAVRIHDALRSGGTAVRQHDGISVIDPTDTSGRDND